MALRWLLAWAHGSHRRVVAADLAAPNQCGYSSSTSNSHCSDSQTPLPHISYAGYLETAFWLGFALIARARSLGFALLGTNWLVARGKFAVFCVARDKFAVFCVARDKLTGFCNWPMRVCHPIAAHRSHGYPENSQLPTWETDTISL